MKSGLVSTSVSQNLGIQYQFQRGPENGLLALGLPKRNVEPIIGIANLSISFNDFRHLPCLLEERGPRLEALPW
jgi:hypothetical protein